MEKTLKPITGTVILHDLRQKILKEYLKRVEWRINGWELVVKDAAGKIVNEKLDYKAIDKELSLTLGGKQLNGSIEIMVGSQVIGILPVTNGIVK